METVWVPDYRQIWGALLIFVQLTSCWWLWYNIHVGFFISVQHSTRGEVKGERLNLTPSMFQVLLPLDVLHFH